MRKEWDFSQIPLAELKACFLYEYARESPTVRRIAEEMKGYEYTDIDDQFEPNFFKLGHHNYDCAVLLANVGSDLNLAATPWQALDKTKRSAWQPPDEKKRTFLAKCVRKEGFKEVPFFEAKFREGLKENRPDLIEHATKEIFSVQIDRTEPFNKIKKQAIDWLQANARRKKQKTKVGRHAKEEALHRDALRRLGALRLLARYPLKRAIEITKAQRVQLYSTFIDGDGRPVHQTAWENGVKGVCKLLQNTFRLDKGELPISWVLYRKRRAKK